MGTTTGYREAFWALPADRQEILKAMDEDDAIAEDAEFEAGRLVSRVRSVVEALAGTPWEKTEEEVRTFLSPQKFQESKCLKPVKIDPFLLRPIEELDLTTRTFHCLVADNIRYIGELVQKSESELLKLPFLGRKSMNELAAVLESHGLTIRTPLPEWRSPNNPFLDRPVCELAIAEEIRFTLQRAGIDYVGDLVRKTREDLPRTGGVDGKVQRSIDDKVSEALAPHNLELGMRIPDWKRPG